MVISTYNAIFSVNEILNKSTSNDEGIMFLKEISLDDLPTVCDIAGTVPMLIDLDLEKKENKEVISFLASNSELERCDIRKVEGVNLIKTKFFNLVINISRSNGPSSGACEFAKQIDRLPCIVNVPISALVNKDNKITLKGLKNVK